MVKKKAAKTDSPTSLEKARDELYSHILRCGVLEASPQHQGDWFDDTLEYFAERYPMLTEAELAELRQLGERYCQPVIRHVTPVGASS